jgi:hypothetical protein
VTKVIEADEELDVALVNGVEGLICIDQSAQLAETLGPPITHAIIRAIDTFAVVGRFLKGKHRPSPRGIMEINGGARSQESSRPIGEVCSFDSRKLLIKVARIEADNRGADL